MSVLTPLSSPQLDWAERSRQAVWHPCTQMKVHERFPPRAIVAADGPWLIDDQGHRILDAVSSWWVNLFGHNFGPIREAITDQLGKLDHIMLAGLTHPPEVELSERLAALPGLGHAFYASDGASATEIALKMSAHSWRNRGQPEKNQFIGLQGGYHGETAGALSVTDIPLFREAYAPLLRLSATLPSPDPRYAAPGVSAEAHTQAAIDALAAYLAEHHAHTAALILEPLVQGAAGMAMYAPDYLLAVRRLCDQYEVHWIADEIAVGFGRTGTLFAHQQARRADGSGVKPDFICLSKGLTGGVLPLSAVLTTFAARDADGRDVLDRNRLAAERFTALTAPLRAHPRVKVTRHIGMIWAWDIDTDEPTLAARYHPAAPEAGLLLRPIGSTLYVMPPYVLTESDQRDLSEGLVQVLDQVLAEIAALPAAVPSTAPGADASRMA